MCVCVCTKEVGGVNDIINCCVCIIVHGACVSLLGESYYCIIL